MYILKLILFSIVMAILAKLMGIEQRKTYEKFKEDLTMEEKPIRIILENYNNEKITFTMPPDATVESMIEMSDKTFKIGRVFIDAKADDITIKKEEFTE